MLSHSIHVVVATAAVAVSSGGALVAQGRHMEADL